MELKPLDTEQIGLKTLEQHIIRSNNNVSLKIGLPKEITNEEARISLTPSGVAILKANGHHIIMEKDAGTAANFSDMEYAEAGAEIVSGAQEVYRRAEIIIKVAPVSENEFELLQNGQTVISAIHFGAQTEKYIRTFLNKSITGIGYEFIQGTDGEFPIVRMMHEITGTMAVQVAAHYLESRSHGKGVLLGGVSGVPPASVVILGAGIIGEYAARAALGYGAQVYALDTNLKALRQLDEALNRRIVTTVANEQYISAAVKSADVIIGAAMVEGSRAPCWVTEMMVAGMKPGSVIVDTVIDQGGCVETSRLTSHSNPVFKEYDVTHYCVPNMPAMVAHTATYALNNVLVPYIISIGDAGGIRESLWQNSALRNGTYTYRNRLTKKPLADMFDLEHRDIDILLATNI